MELTSGVRYFLGANSKNGFYSLYDGFTAPLEGDFLHVIKGGPGCGKSTLMRRIGEYAGQRGEAVEYILCSGDPDSLDGVYLPGLRTAYVDGTAPHVQEAEYPGAASDYLDMSRFLDTAALRGSLPEIAALNRRYKALYAEAYALLAAGAALLPKNCPGLRDAEEAARADRKTQALAEREMPRLKKTGALRRRFLSALSCRGRLFLPDALEGKQVWLLDNALGLGHLYLAQLCTLAGERGYDRLLCPDPLEPEKPEALILPEAQLAFLAAEQSPETAEAAQWRRLHLDAALDRELTEAQRETLRRRGRESARLLEEATRTLARAKELHDALEAYYRPHVDFAGASALAEAETRRLFP